MIPVAGNLFIARLVIAGVLAAMTFGTLGGLVYLKMQLETPPAPGTAEVTVVVTAPGGRGLFNATLPVENATAFTGLERAAEVAKFQVRTREYPNGLYVYAIAGYEARGSSGWIYEVTRADETIWGDRASDLFGLEDGDRLHWRWSDAPPT